MTTSRSPISQLRAQADKIAATLKAAERGEDIGVNDPAGKIAAARKGESVRAAVLMDDKIIQVYMRWDFIRETSEAGIAEYILGEMRDSRG